MKFASLLITQLNKKFTFYEFLEKSKEIIPIQPKIIIIFVFYNNKQQDNSYILSMFKKLWEVRLLFDNESSINI